MMKARQPLLGVGFSCFLSLVVDERWPMSVIFLVGGLDGLGGSVALLINTGGIQPLRGSLKSSKALSPWVHMARGRPWAPEARSRPECQRAVDRAVVIADSMPNSWGKAWAEPRGRRQAPNRRPDAGSWVITTGAFAGRIRRWGGNFLFIFQKGIEGLLYLKGVGVGTSQCAVQHL